MSFPRSSSCTEVNGWCAAAQRFSSGFHSNMGKSRTHRNSNRLGSRSLCRSLYFWAADKRNWPPELGFDAAEAALDPLGGDEGVDERELGGAGGSVVEEELDGEGFEFSGIFAGNDVGPGVDAGFEGV